MKKTKNKRKHAETGLPPGVKAIPRSILRNPPTNTVVKDRHLLGRWAELGIIEPPVGYEHRGRAGGPTAVETVETAARLVILSEYYGKSADGRPSKLSKAIGDGAYAVILALHGAFPLNDRGWELIRDTVIKIISKRQDSIKREFQKMPLISETPNIDELVFHVLGQKATRKPKKAIESGLSSVDVPGVVYHDFEEFSNENMTGKWETLARGSGERPDTVKLETGRETVMLFNQLSKMKSPKELVEFLNELPVEEWKPLFDRIVSLSIGSLWVGTPMEQISYGTMFRRFRDDPSALESHIFQTFVVYPLVSVSANRETRRAFEKGFTKLGLTAEKIWAEYRARALERIQFPEPETGE